MNYPVFSVIIPTFNSERTLNKCLKSVRNQSYPQKKVEILVIDGGSTDRTISLAKKYGAKVIPNPKIHQVYAKHLGYLKSKGKYIVHLDSDEVLGNKDGFLLTLRVFRKNKKVRAVLSSGYVSPTGYSFANSMVLEYGDAFSYFVYRACASYGFFEKTVKASCQITHEDHESFIVQSPQDRSLPLIELSVMGYTLDREYLRRTFPRLSREPFLISHLYYLIVQDGGLIAVLKNYPIIHYSANSFKNYLKKINSRVVNNVYKNEMGKSAFSGRNEFYSPWFNLKKYLFPLYTLSLVIPFVDGIYLSITRKNAVFMLHPLFCLYILLLTIKYYLLKAFNVWPELKPWGL